MDKVEIFRNRLKEAIGLAIEDDVGLSQIIGELEFVKLAIFRSYMKADEKE